MSISPQNLFRHELIGLEAHVVNSRDPSHVSHSGKIVGESKEMIQMDTDDGEILLPKEVCVFRIKLPDGDLVQVDGDLLRGRPEDRLKKRVSRRW
jgi:ribonuclease P protein subunit POP4